MAYFMRVFYVLACAERCFRLVFALSGYAPASGKNAESLVASSGHRIERLALRLVASAVFFCELSAPVSDIRARAYRLFARSYGRNQA